MRQDEPTPDEELDKLPISAEVDGKWQTFPNAAAADEALNAEPMPEAVGNFHITDDNLGVGGPKQKFARNIEAIQTLRTLEQEHRGATAEEQQVLAQYVGWGGLADAFDPNKENWSAEYTQLKELLTEEEYAAARASTLNAHYTSPVVIRAIYNAVEKMGFQSGNILEPSMGMQQLHISSEPVVSYLQVSSQSSGTGASSGTSGISSNGSSRCLRSISYARLLLQLTR